MRVLTATDKSKAKFLPTEFYMRRKGKAYFRNKYGKIVIDDSGLFECGKTYQFKIGSLTRGTG